MTDGVRRMKHKENLKKPQQDLFLPSCLRRGEAFAGISMPLTNILFVKGMDVFLFFIPANASPLLII